jgi:hypothetical protein
MFNERASYIQQRIVAGTWHFRSAKLNDQAREEMMSGAIIAFGMAVGAATLICYRLLMRCRDAVSLVDPPPMASDRLAAMMLVTAEAISPGAQAKIPHPII